MMKRTLLSFLLDKNNGLITADMPTGFGKTYNCVEVMYEYIYIKNGIKRQFHINNYIKKKSSNTRFKKCI